MSDQTSSTGPDETAKILNEVVGHYLASSDFNGIRVSQLADRTRLASGQAVERIKELVQQGLVSVNFGDRHPNPLIQAFWPEPAEKQILKFANANLGFSCVYPTQAALKDRVNPTHYEGRPFTLRLARGEPQLHFETFDLAVLEAYRNDPRLRYDTNDIGGRICITDEFFFSEHTQEAEKVFLQTFGFAYDDTFNRAVAVFLRYLSDLSPEHQRIWQAKIVKGKYFLHPDYARSSGGDWPEKISLFDAFLEEMRQINTMCRLIGKPPFFRDAPDQGDRPRGFSFLLRPTVKEFQDFVSLLDKLLSDNLNKEFFRGDVELTRDVLRKDGKIEVQQKGTISLFEEWVEKRFTPRDPEPLKTLFATLKEIRKLRQRPAHALDDNRFDQAIFREQRELAVRAYEAVRLIRRLFANHPHARSHEIPEWLFEGRIWTF
jgi:hypothetical protein